MKNTITETFKKINCFFGIQSPTDKIMFNGFLLMIVTFTVVAISNM